ncbi:DUF1778 domain-containing protein [Clostridium perfringens]|nr:DUF1778 domain-containing protein [Clostridium perfringens]
MVWRGNMAKKAEKLEELKIRLTKEDKQLIKAAAASKGITMTQFILDMAVPTAKRELEYINYKDIIEEKIVHTDKKLQEIKKKLQERKVQPKSLFEIIFARKT